MLSVIIKEGERTDRLEKLCRHELRGEKAEVIRAPNWLEGLGQSKGEYVCLLEETFDLSDGYFHDLLDVFLDQPSFRKMAMVAPAVANPHWSLGRRVYGYLVSPTHIMPSNIKSSFQPYTVQIAYIPGAIIRKAVLQYMEPDFGKNPLHDSIRLSLAFWENGLRCLLSPQTTYYTSTEKLDMPIPWKNTPEVEELLIMFRREFIQ